LAARRGKKRAIIAIGHSILKSVYNILKYKCEYSELGEQYMLERTEAKRKKYLKGELAKLGYDLSTLVEKPKKVEAA
jgi:hypothetical protein